MARLYAFGPMSIFAYQVYLAFTGRDPLMVYSILPTYLIRDIAHVVKLALI
jgi:hypothetical protein